MLPQRQQSGQILWESCSLLPVGIRTGVFTGLYSGGDGRVVSKVGVISAERRIARRALNPTSPAASSVSWLPFSNRPAMTEREIVLEIRGLTDATPRACYLDRACGSDQAAIDPDRAGALSRPTGTRFSCTSTFAEVGSGPNQ